MLAEALARDAAADEIRLAAGTWQLVRHAATGTPLPGDAVALGSVDAHAPPIDRRLDAPLVGRRAELEHLDAALARVAAARPGGAASPSSARPASASRGSWRSSAARRRPRARACRAAARRTARA